MNYRLLLASCALWGIGILQRDGSEASNMGPVAKFGDWLLMSWQLGATPGGRTVPARLFHCNGIGARLDYLGVGTG